MEGPEFSGVIAPNKIHLAFAIAIVKQKPPDKDVKGEWPLSLIPIHKG